MTSVKEGYLTGIYIMAISFTCGFIISYFLNQALGNLIPVVMLVVYSLIAPVMFGALYFRMLEIPHVEGNKNQ